MVDACSSHLNQHLLQMECTLAKQMLQQKEMETVNDVLKELFPLKTELFLYRLESTVVLTLHCTNMIS